MVITKEQALEEVIHSFSRTTDEMFTLDEFRKQLQSGRQLRLKYGADVTAPDLHIGHAVNLWMYRELQELGHKFVFLVGDYTTRIGDPTGKSKTRPEIPEEEIRANAEEFIRQVTLVVHDDPEVFEVRRNSEWLDPLSSAQLLSLLSMVTHDRLISRDMFRRRLEEGKSIYMHEMMYPILQGYDSFALEADLTIIGSDQLFNEMMGRFYQERFSKVPQVIITSKITPGIDGGEKQSKSIGNYIGLNHSPRDKFGRVMRLPDALITEYFRVYTKRPLEDVSRIEQALMEDPMGHKFDLAMEIVARYHGRDVAEAEKQWFIETFRNQQVPEDVPLIAVGRNSLSALELLRACYSVEEKSNGALKRLLKQGGVKVDGQTVSAPESVITLSEIPIELKVGKRSWFRVIK